VPITAQIGKNSFNGVWFMPLATKPSHFSDNSFSAFSACSLLSNAANTHAPVPVSFDSPLSQ